MELPSTALSLPKNGTKFVNRSPWKLEGFRPNIALSYLVHVLYFLVALSLNLTLRTVCCSFLMYFTSLSSAEIVPSDRAQ
jgi:hypothetical protein